LIFPVHFRITMPKLVVTISAEPIISWMEIDVLNTITSMTKDSTICKYRTDDTLPAFSSWYEALRKNCEKNPKAHNISNLIQSSYVYTVG
jgi:hypothetical protein